ncbi:MAG: cbb3-type cytochrome oxidase assembly protein CcoS [Verrucomicrobiales bacterium]|nr:cbb3-type cytochrome oxidase assembly protein CcoS [Verrucomicrobiales bacterium]
MSALYLLILVSLLIALGFLIAYLWAVRHGQYDDTSTPALRVLLDEPPPAPPLPSKARKGATSTNHGESPNPPHR